MIDKQLLDIIQLYNLDSADFESITSRYKANMNSKGIALIRVSTKAQDLEQQTEKVKSEMLKDGFNEDNIIYISDAESASKLSEEERSGLNKLKHYIETEQDVSSVYVYEISRISRKEIILYSIRDYLQRHHIQLVCLVPYFKVFNDDWTISDQAAFTFSIFSTLSSQETRIRTSRIMRGKEKKKSEGRLTCGSPFFGYTLDSEKHPIPDPVEAPIVREIFQRYSSLESCSSIGKDLYYRGALANRSSKMVTVQTYVCGILRDKRYGNLVESIYPPLVSKELWLKCEDIRNNRPKYFKRKGKTIACYPLQGYLYTEDGYRLTPSITNNRYLKMNGVSKYPLSLNMTNCHTLCFYVMNKYSENIQPMNIESERERLHRELIKERNIIDSSRIRIDSLSKENDFINSRIIKGRLSEDKGDSMIDENIKQMYLLEDSIQDSTYKVSIIENRLNYLANPLFSENSQNEKITTLEALKEFCIKYLQKVIVRKLKFSTYSLEFHFLDGFQCIYSFYSINRGVHFYDSTGQEISIQESPIQRN